MVGDNQRIRQSATDSARDVSQHCANQHGANRRLAADWHSADSTPGVGIFRTRNVETHVS